jgi:hypothetical protein
VNRELFYASAGIIAQGEGEWDCGLRIADLLGLFDSGCKIEIENFINPQSAIRNPQSHSPFPFPTDCNRVCAQSP